MNNPQLSFTSSSFLQSVEEDLPVTKLFKYRHFLTNYSAQAKQIFDKMTEYALEKNLVGEYEAIHDVIRAPLQKVGKYKDMRQQMIDYTNPVRNQIQHAESIQNIEDMVSGYFKIAEYYRRVGMHKQAAQYYNKLFRSQSGQKQIYQRSQYFSAWAQQLWFDNNWVELNIFIRQDLEDIKKVDCTLAIVKDLKYIQMGQFSSKFFDNILNGGYTINEIISNSIVSYVDLGTIYSLVALATKSRNQLKIKRLWSGKLEVLYLQNKFSLLLQKMHNIYEREGKFHPLIDKIYVELSQKIRKRVLKKYLSAYTTISYKQIQQNTTFSEGQLKILLKDNPTLPYLMDPITQSIVFYQKELPLHEQASTYYLLIKEKYKEQIRSCLNAKKTEDLQFSPKGLFGSSHREGRGGMFGRHGFGFDM